ncbi:hypothetical protein AX15_007855, partial [Amanita polypyramis BW_CC]
MYWKQGRWDEAEKLHVHVMEAWKIKLGEDHPATLDSITSLAFAYKNQGRLEDAQRLECHVMRANKAEINSDTFNRKDNKEATHEHQREVDKAVLPTETIRSMEQSVEPGNPVHLHVGQPMQETQGYSQQTDQEV